ncbi:MAG: tetratricopeptide repeat protein [Sphingobacteriales bacterium]|nr:MAG: tetratricopeptide repeat protein [Sphingobacteriales bacterium]
MKQLLVSIFIILHIWIAESSASVPVLLAKATQLKSLADSANFYVYKDLNKANIFISKGISLSDNLKNDSAKAAFMDLQGKVKFINGNYIAALQHYESSLYLRKKNNLYPLIITSLINIGNVYEKLGQYPTALKYFLQAFQKSDSTKDEVNKGTSLNCLGIIYISMQHFTSASMYLNQSKQVYTKLNYKPGLGIVNSNLGLLFRFENNFDSSEYYYKQAEVNYIEAKKNNSDLAQLYSDIGGLYTNYEYHAKAMEYYNKALALHKDLQDVKSHAYLLNNIGVSYHDQGKFKDALVYLKQAEDLANKTQNISLITDIYYNISSAYQELGQYKIALDYQQQYSDLKDTLFTKESNKLIAEMRQKYEADQSEKEIAKLRTEKTLQQNILTIRTQQRNLIFLSAVMTLIAVSFFAYSYRQKLRLKNIIVQQNEEKNRQQINDLLKEQEIKAISAMISGQEQERQRVAQDLHDRLGSLLSTVKLNLGGLEKKMEQSQANMEPYKRGILLLDEACSEVRKIAYDMASGVLQKYGFVTSVQELKKSIESSNKIKVNLYTHNTEIPVDKDTEINLYRVAQELISNILKHANATEINIQYNIIDGNINLMVEDNGIGFDINKSAKGMGISNIHARVNKLDGNIIYDSTPESGTTVIINVPVKNSALLNTAKMFTV